MHTGSLLDFHQGGVTRYHQLSIVFRRRIENGEWPVGLQIPTIEQLSSEFGVAVATVRKALDGLAHDGLLIRQKAKGTFVLRKPAERIWREIETDSRGFLRSRGGASIELVSHALIDRPPLEPHPEGRLADSYLWLRRRHWRDGRPFVLVDTYIDGRLAQHIPESDFGTRLSQDLLKDVPGLEIRSLHQTMTIGSADLEPARLLEIPLNSPVAKIDRTRIDTNGAAILISRGIYRADVVRLEFHEDPRRR